METNPHLYIDYGSHKITAAAGVVSDDNKLEILGTQSRDSNDIESGVIIDVGGAAFKTGEVIKLLSNFIKRKKYHKTSISINAQSMRNIFIETEKSITNQVTEEFVNSMEDECIRNIEEKSEKIHIFKIYHHEYFIDGRKVDNPYGQSGKKLQVVFNLIIGNKTVIDNIYKTVVRIPQINLDYTIMGVDAIAKAILSDEDLEKGVAFISLEGSITTYAAFSEGKLQDYLVIPLGGDDITNDIQTIGISYENAEKLKHKFGSAVFDKIDKAQLISIPNANPSKDSIRVTDTYLAKIVEARLEEILEPIIERINTPHIDLKNGIILTGGGSKLKYIDEYIMGKTSITTVRSDHSEHLHPESKPEYFEPEYAHLVGAFLLTNQMAYDDSIRREPPFVNPWKGTIKKFSKKVKESVENLFTYDEQEESEAVETKNE